MLRRDLKGKECTQWLLAWGASPGAGGVSSWGYGRRTYTDAKEMFFFLLKTLQLTWLAAVTQLSAVLSFTQTPWLAWKRAGCVGKPLQGAASAALLSPPGRRDRPAAPRAVGAALLSPDSRGWARGCHITRAPEGQQGPSFPPPCPAPCPDCCWLCCRPRELWGYSAHTVPPHRLSSGEDTNLNLTRIHFCLKQALVTTSLHDGIFCATWSWMTVMF